MFYPHDEPLGIFTVTSHLQIRIQPLRVFLVVVFFRAALAADGGSQARGRMGAIAAGRHHSHSNAGSKQLMTYTTASGAPDP